MTIGKSEAEYGSQTLVGSIRKCYGGLFAETRPEFTMDNGISTGALIALFVFS